MAYMNLLVRYRADLLDTPEDYNKAAGAGGEADQWMTKSLDTKKAKAERKAAQANGAKTQ
jgi:hypothetical protein